MSNARAQSARTLACGFRQSTLERTPTADTLPSSSGGLEGAIVDGQPAPELCRPHFQRKGASAMKRMDRLLLLVLVAALGCRAPMPAFNPLAPYGSTRVPPPATGNVNQPNSYYSPTGQPASGQPTLTTPPRTGYPANPPGNGWSAQPSPPTTTTASASQTTLPSASVVPAPASGVALASYPAAVVPPPEKPSSSAPVTMNSTSSDAAALRLRGMPVNDATRQEPQPFLPSGQVIDITELPDPPPPIRLPGGGAANPAGTTSSVPADAPPAVVGSTWQTRPLTSPTAPNSPP